MKQLSTLALLIWIALLTSCSEDKMEAQEETIEVPDGYTLIWQDEFDETSIDATKWTYETGDGTDYGLPAGWGNNERQIYTTLPENSGVEMDEDMSVLAITAKSDGNGGYTSAKLTTNDLFSLRYGRVDVRAKMPQGQGIWPAIWMLGDNISEIDWPGCGEIDIVELLGHQPEKMYSTIHYTDFENSHAESQQSHELTTGSFSDSYHVFSVDWTPQSLSFRVDGMTINEIPIETDMKEFRRSFYLIMNVAVGGNWPGYPDNTTILPQKMMVDYVRVFENNAITPDEAPALDIDEETIGQNIAPSLAQYAIQESFEDLGVTTVIVYGGGGEPTVATSDVALDGDSSVVFDFPGGSWGGGYFELARGVDLSSYSMLKFSLHKPQNLINAEIKLESPKTNAFVYLKDYSGTDVGSGYLEYSIPLADYTGLDLTNITIAFSIWNPQDATDSFTSGTVLIDNIHFAN
ncbi:MAG: glycoside hydrolase family 16 protein [Cyclobacteriaceae bacterium]